MGKGRAPESKTESKTFWARSLSCGGRKDDTQIREALQFWGTPKDIGELECCYREDWAGLAGSLGPPKSVRNKNCDPENIEQV